MIKMSVWGRNFEIENGQIVTDDAELRRELLLALADRAEVINVGPLSSDGALAHKLAVTTGAVVTSKPPKGNPLTVY